MKTLELHLAQGDSERGSIPILNVRLSTSISHAYNKFTQDDIILIVAPYVERIRFAMILNTKVYQTYKLLNSFH